MASATFVSRLVRIVWIIESVEKTAWRIFRHTDEAVLNIRSIRRGDPLICAGRADSSMSSTQHVRWQSWGVDRSAGILI